MLVLLALAGYAWYMRHPTVASVLRGTISLPAQEVAALEAVLADAGVPPDRVRVVPVDPDTPCWSYTYRRWWEERLRVYRRFGHNCIGIDRGHVVGLSLVETSLADMRPLADLTALQNLQLRDARIETLAGLPADCRWRQVILAQNALTDVKPLARCEALEHLDLTFNRLTALPDLAPLRRLERLDLRKNELADITGLAGHPALTWIDLTANRLTAVDGLAGLPRLEMLHLGSNALTALRGLRDLPALQSLYAYRNRLETVEADVLAGLPALRHVSLDGTLLRALPPGYTYAGRGLRPVVIHPEAGPLPRIEVNNTPLAEALQKQAVADHDPRTVYPVDRLPRGRGTARQASRRGRAQGGLLSDGLDYEGRIGSLSGTLSERFDTLSRQVGVQVTASVERGRLRVYLAASDDGYYYAEALPGKPIAMSGLLISSTGYFIYFESVGGPAEGIHWTVKG